MRLTFREAVRAWLAYRHTCFRPKCGWLWWLAFGRRVDYLCEVGCDGPVEATAPAGVYAQTQEVTVRPRPGVTR